LRLLFITSRPEPGSAWPGVCGRITRELLTLAVPDFAQRRVFCCGPAPFMRGIKDMLKEAEFPMDRYHEESFGGAKKPAPPSAAVAANLAADATPAQGLAAILRGLGTKAPAAIAPATPAPEARRAAPAATADGITCGRSKRSIPCPPGYSLLEAIEDAGISWPSGCRMGKCGTCKAKLLAGQLDRSSYDDAILSPADRSNGFVLTCVGKPAGAVTIDA
jgi:ferredoxin-NADP reductase